jgi:hypothetical protein
MKALNNGKKSDEAGKIRTTISISDDLDPETSDKVRTRMRARRSPSFSNYVEVLVAEDTGLKPREAVAA